MIRRSSVIIAASLAVLSTFQPGLCFAAAAPAGVHEDVERPQSLRKEIKRFVFSNSTHEAKPAPSPTPLDHIVAQLTTPLPAHSPTTTEPKTTHHAKTTSDNLRLAVPDAQSVAAKSLSLAQHEILLAQQHTTSTSTHHAPSAAAEKAASLSRAASRLLEASEIKAASQIKAASKSKAAAQPSDATSAPSKSQGKPSVSSAAALAGNLPVVGNLLNVNAGATPSTGAHQSSAVAGKSPAIHSTTAKKPTTSDAGVQLLPSKLPNANLRILQQQAASSSPSSPSASSVGTGSQGGKGGSTTSGTTASSSAGAGLLGGLQSVVGSLIPTSSAGVLGPVKSVVDSLVSPIIPGHSTSAAGGVNSQSHQTASPTTASSHAGGLLPVVASLLPTPVLGGLASSKPHVVSSLLNGVVSPLHFSLQTTAPVVDVSSALGGVVSQVKSALPVSSLASVVAAAVPATGTATGQSGAAPVSAGSTPPKSTAQPILPLSDILGSVQSNPAHAVVPSHVTDSLFNALTNALNTNAPTSTTPPGSSGAGAGLSIGANLGIGGSSLLGASLGVGVNVGAQSTSVGVGVAIPASSAINLPVIALPSVTLANGSVVPNPSNIVQSVVSGVSAVVSSVVGGKLPASVPLPTGSVVSNPTNVVQSVASGVASVVQSVGSEVSAIVSSVASGQTPASVTLPNGSVVPSTASANIVSSVAAVLSSVPLSHGDIFPQASGVSPPSGQSTPTLPTGSAALITGSAVANDSSLQSQGSQTSQPSVVAPVGESRVGGQISSVASAVASNAASAVNPSPTSPGPVVSEAGSTVSRTPVPIATVPQVYATKQAGPLTQQPTGYDSMTALLVPSSIIVEPSTSLPSASSDLGPTGLPTDVPLVLYPPSGPVNRPENTELIQIGFLHPLNYDFVWKHQKSQQQIFTYLPLGIAYGLNIEIANITMQTLRAWDTTQDLHYITTLALAWVPADLVETLELIKSTTSSKFYHHPDASVRTLIEMVNPTIPIRADNGTDGGSSTAYGAAPSDTSTSSVNNGAPIGGGIGGSQPVKASSVGIGVGVVFGAAAYGAAMFFVARRYKKRRQSHTRSPGMLNSPVMSHVGPDPAAGAALMSGAMGERAASPYYDNDGRGSRGSGGSGSSARQQISAPVMAENSLGWN